MKNVFLFFFFFLVFFLFVVCVQCGCLLLVLPVEIGNGYSGKVAYLPAGDIYGMAYNGTNGGYFNLSSYDIPSDCGDLLYRIYDDWDSSMIYLSGHDNCSAAVGYFYDPTVSCAYDSGNIYCTTLNMTYLCDDTSYSYECDYSQAETRFLCAPGDLSGKFGALDSSASSVQFIENDEFMIDLDLLDGSKSLVLQCEDTYEIIACGQFMDAGGDTTTTATMTDYTTTGDDDTTTTDIDTDNGFATSVQFATIVVGIITMIKMIV